MILGIYGTGGGGKETKLVVEGVLKQHPLWDHIVFLDDTLPEGFFHDYHRYPFEVFKTLYSNKEAVIHVAIGELSSKHAVADKVKQSGYKLSAIVHPDAIIGNNVTIEPGVQIKMGVKIEDNVILKEGTWIQAYASVGSDCVIANYCQISAKASIGNRVIVDENVFIGMHASVASDVHIKPFAVISMGASVHKDIEEECVCMGNPGRVMAKNTSHKIF